LKQRVVGFAVDTYHPKTIGNFNISSKQTRKLIQTAPWERFKLELRSKCCLITLAIALASILSACSGLYKRLMHFLCCQHYGALFVATRSALNENTVKYRKSIVYY